MNAPIVQARYDELDQIAARFSQLAERNADLERRLSYAFHPLQEGGWIGRGSDAFTQTMRTEIFPACQRLNVALEAAREVTLQIQRIFQASEAEAAAVFQGGADATLISGIAGGALAGIGALMKGVALNALFPGRYAFRSLIPNAARGQTTVAAIIDRLAGKPGRGLWLIRFDGPHGTHPYPHININPKLTGLLDPHTPISPALLKIAGVGARVLDGARRIAIPIAVTTDVLRVGAAIQSDGGQFGEATKRTVGSVAGGWGGAYAGAKAGAAGGAMLGGLAGSVLPGVGTVVGAGVGGVLGGLVGAVGGGIGGSWLGEQIGEAL